MRTPSRRSCLTSLVLLAPATGGSCLAQTTTMRQYQYAPRADDESYTVVLKQVPRPTPGPGQVLVRIHATSINGG